MAREIVGRVLALQRAAQARDVAISLFKEGQSAAEVWEALVSSGVEQATAEALVRELDQLRRQVEDAAPPANAAAPPVVQYGNDGWVQVKTGSYAQGFALGLCFGCWALLFAGLSHNMGTETKRGLYAGFFTGFGVAVVLAMIQAAAHSR
jgi:hypothetical protein